MSHEAITMVGGSRFPKKKRFVIRNKPCERNVWYKVFTCPKCGGVKHRLQNPFEGKPGPICDGS